MRAARIDLPLAGPDGRALDDEPVRRRERQARAGAEALALALAGQAHRPGARARGLDPVGAAARLVPEQPAAADLHPLDAILVPAGGLARGPKTFVGQTVLQSSPGLRRGRGRPLDPRLALSRSPVGAKSERGGKAGQNPTIDPHAAHLARASLARASGSRPLAGGEVT